MATSMSQVQQCTIGMASAKHFHIFGHGISFSKSPAIHMAGFQHYGLPHTYDIQEPANVDEIAHLIEDESFGGGSVTMPHKLSVQKFCVQQTNHARQIGAINTLIVRHDEMGQRNIIGDNTDWSGLHNIISARTRSWPKRPRSSLVIGAGGASRAALYALHRSGLTEIVIVNRTRAKANKIASDFSSIFYVKVISALQDLDSRPDIVIGTVPADKTTETDFGDVFEGANELGLCIDMSYKPRRTPLLRVAGSNVGWETVSGIEVLLHQAFDQFELWTGLKAPQEEMIAKSDVQEVEEIPEKL